MQWRADEGLGEFAPRSITMPLTLTLSPKDGEREKIAAIQPPAAFASASG